MADRNSFTIVISALDKASATFRHIQGRVAALGKATGVTQLVQAAENAGTKFAALGSRISSLLGPIAALGAGVSAAGLFEMAKGASDWGTQLYIASKKTGVAADALAKLHYVGETVNVDADSMDRALFRLNLTIQKAAGGKGKDAIAMFRGLGISLRDSQHHIRDVTSVLADLSEATIRNPQLAQMIAGTAFGARQGAAMIPVLEMGREELKRLYATFEQTYGRITPEIVKAAYEAHESFGRLSLAMSGLKFTIGSALYPALESLIVPLTKWLVVNRKVIALRTSQWATELAAAIKKIDWAKVGAALFAMGRAVGYVFRLFGPFWSTVLIAGVVFSPFIVATLAAGKALVILAVRLLAIPFAGLVASILEVIPMIGGMADAWAALDLVLAANPFGAIVIGALALAGAGYLVYKNWKLVKGVFQEIADSKFGKVLSALVSLTPVGQGDVVNLKRPPPGSWLATGNFGKQAPGKAPRGSAPLGVRLNNPANLRSFGHTPTVLTGSGTFAKFPTAEAGVAAAAGNLLAYQQRHHLNTIAQIIARWAPSSENNTAAYIRQVSRATGFAPSATLNLSDPGTMQKLLTAMISHEQGYNPYSQSIISAGIAARLGGGSPGRDGNVHVKVDVTAPRGTSVRAAKTGEAVASLDVGRRFSYA